MVDATNVVIHFKELPVEEPVLEHLTRRCRDMMQELPETARFELTIEANAAGIDGHCHVTGKGTAVAAHISDAENARQAGDQALEKVGRELRKEHDKRIFAPRRKAQRERAKRMP